MLIFIIAVSGILLFGILYSNLKVRLSYIKRGEDNDIVIDWTGLYGILKYTKKIPAMNMVKTGGNIPPPEIGTQARIDKDNEPIDDDKPVHNVYEIKKVIDNYKKIYIKYEPYIKKIKENLILNNISWYTEIGTGDAAETAIMVGAIWAVKTSVIFLINKSYDLPEVLINVVPNYNINTFETTIDCIFSIKLGYIINANIKVLLAQIKDGVKK